MKILVVEDEVKLTVILKQVLEEQGYRVEVARDGREGLEKIQTREYDLALLDINLPFISGLKLCELARQHRPNLPILMVTALASTEDVVAGLDTGADDYLAKPFRMEELLARVRALGRRALIPQKPEGETPEAAFQLADLTVNFDAREVRRAGKPITLTAREYELLAYLAHNQGRVRSRLEIAEAVWGLDFDTGTNFIEVYVSYLRNKVDKPFDKKLIHTVVGLGYVLKEDEG